MTHTGRKTYPACVRNNITVKIPTVKNITYNTRACSNTYQSHCMTFWHVYLTQGHTSATVLPNKLSDFPPLIRLP